MPVWQDVLNLDRNLSSEEDEIVSKEKKASLRLQKSIARSIGKMDEIVAELENQKKESMLSISISLDTLVNVRAHACFVVSSRLQCLFLDGLI